MRCSFCIIPFTRGAQRSRPVAEVVAEVGRLVERGTREVVLTGVQISAYRAGGARLADLVAAVLGETAVPRLRLTSIAPWRLDRRLLTLWADPRLCRHVHLSLQSGCDATLRRMRRPYTAARFAAAVAAIRDAAPGVAVTTDVIVGFPGEDETEFQESLAFTAGTGFARVHAFPYSRRTGTAAAAHGDGVPVAAVRRRMAAMLAVAEASERRYRERHVGATVEVLWERRRAVRWRGLTGNYLRVYAPVEGEELGNRITEARLLALSGDGLLGRPGAAAAG
jgi:threonylcarbamoyladenosine tRNA methylthiotransferase MtaB